MGAYIALVELEAGGKLVPLIDGNGHMLAFPTCEDAERAALERVASIPNYPVRVVVDLNSWGVSHSL
ncbi:TPA: hypothetical protein VDW20_001749 [Pseudomonas aeruginosa]|nr:hypothetical protein [Pseudomonas aeruginosa]